RVLPRSTLFPYTTLFRSGLEMSQNSLRLSWTREEVDEKLNHIMNDIHAACVKYGKREDGYIDYVKGANVAGFVKVADAMLAQGRSEEHTSELQSRENLVC